MSTISTCQISL